MVIPTNVLTFFARSKRFFTPPLAELMECLQHKNPVNRLVFFSGIFRQEQEFVFQLKNSLKGRELLVFVFRESYRRMLPANRIVLHQGRNKTVIAYIVDKVPVCPGNVIFSIIERVWRCEVFRHTYVFKAVVLQVEGP